VARRPFGLPLLFLAAAGCGGGEPTAAWLGRLTDADPATRLTAVKTLGQRPGEADAIVPPLAERLRQDDDPYVRRDSANALGGFGPAARPAWPEMLDAARRDRDPRVRRAAAAALKKIDPAAAARDGVH
jgi:HEAT repeat protein